MEGSKSKTAPLATLPSTLHPSEYDLSPETRKTQIEHLSIRARLKWEYLLQSTNTYPSFRPTPKNSLLGVLAAFGPLIFWYYVFKTDRDRKEKLIQEGKLDRTFKLSY
uniref:NADH dehydrogenase [ubiquinone] 1 beta subcomplex subunit 4 n=1 Tax=Cricetulus griseus TaxID=10029 RepID=A0A8C2QLU3_CRIGR